MKLSALDSFPKHRIDEIRRHDPELADALTKVDGGDGVVQQHELVSLQNPDFAKRYLKVVGLITTEHAQERAKLSLEKRKSREEMLDQVKESLRDLYGELSPVLKFAGAAAFAFLGSSFISHMVGQFNGGDFGKVMLDGYATLFSAGLGIKLALDGTAEALPKIQAGMQKLASLVTSEDRKKLNQLLDS